MLYSKCDKINNMHYKVAVYTYIYDIVTKTGQIRHKNELL